MRRTLTIMVALLLGATTAWAATLTVRGTTPTQVNDGTCDAPVLLPTTSLKVVHTQVVGRALEDSVTAMPGVPFSFSWQVPAGTYTVRAWVSQAAYPHLVSCDTSAVFAAPAKPDKPRLTP